MIKATQSNRPTVTLYFDRESVLCVKATYTGTENLQPAAKEFLFIGVREFEGQRLPAKMQVFQSGKKIEEWTVESCRFPAKIEDREFAKPEGK